MCPYVYAKEIIENVFAKAKQLFIRMKRGDFIKNNCH